MSGLMILAHIRIRVKDRIEGSKVYLMLNKRSSPTANLDHSPVNSVDKHGPYFKLSELLKNFLGPSNFILSRCLDIIRYLRKAPTMEDRN